MAKFPKKKQKTIELQYFLKTTQKLAKRGKFSPNFRKNNTPMEEEEVAALSLEEELGPSGSQATAV